MGRLLMVAFHFPPFQGSSGILRTWNFSRYLGKYGWEPTVLTASTRAYASVQEGGEGSLQIPGNIKVQRAAGLDASRHFAIRGRFPRWLAMPDRWISWYPFALLSGLRAIRRDKHAVIWSTFPIPTAHVVALSLHKLTGLPWIADFRDSMTEEQYPTDPVKRSMYLSIERRVVHRASAVVFTTEGTRRIYMARYPQVPQERFLVIANGYDEESFARAEHLVGESSAKKSNIVTLLHSGILYPSERDPRPLLVALARLKAAGRVNSSDLQVRFRASGHDELISSLISEHGLKDIVHLEPPISYGAALAEMISVDALLLMQAANSNHQVPAKVYEYFRAGKPILALTDQAGETAAVLRAAGVSFMADLSNATDIEEKLPAFLSLIREGRAPIVSREIAATHSREAQAARLAELLTHTVAQHRKIAKL